MRYLAVLKDSLVEVLDRKSLYFLLVVSVVIVGFCASIGYTELTVQKAIENIVDSFKSVLEFRSGEGKWTPYSVTYETSEFKELKADAGDFTGGYQFNLKVFPTSEMHREIHHWAVARKNFTKRKPDPIVAFDVTAEQERSFVETHLRENGCGRVEAVAVPGLPMERRFEIRIRPSSRKSLEEGYEITMLFGLCPTPWKSSIPSLLTTTEYLVSNAVVGWLGVLIAVVFTASFIPNMMQKGTLDLMLARPVRRPLILLVKYVGGLLYVLIPATFLIGSCWLVLSMRADHYNFGFLMAIPMMVAMFSVLYSFSVLMGVWLKSTIGAISLTLSLWVSTWGLNTVRELYNIGFLNLPEPIVKILAVAHAILPKTGDFGIVARNFITKGNHGIDATGVVEPGALTVDGTLLVVSSIAFVVVMLGLACWIFKRRDC